MEWRALLRGEVHVPNDGIGQQLLRVLPQQFLAYFRLELDLDRLKVLHPALRCNEGIIGAKEEAVLQARGCLAQQTVQNVTG